MDFPPLPVMFQGVLCCCRDREYPLYPLFLETRWIALLRLNQISPLVLLVCSPFTGSYRIFASINFLGAAVTTPSFSAATAHVKRDVN